MESNDANRLSELQTMNRIYEQQLQIANTSLENATKEQSKMANHFGSELTRLNDEQKHFITSLTGNTCKGTIGERFVDEVFSELELGVLDDVSQKKQIGYADRFWSYDFNNTMIPSIRGLIEVKYTKTIHSINDLQKFDNDVKTAVRQNRINCAIIISLSARIHGDKQISISFVDGIPVLKASRNVTDTLTSSNLVKIAFLTLHQMWPYMNSNKSKNEDFLLSAFSKFLDSHMDRIQKLQEKSTLLEKMGTSLLRESAALLKWKDDIVHDIESLRLRYPQVITNNCHDKGESIELLQIVTDGVEKYRQRTKRYPKTLNDLNLKLDANVVTNDIIFKNAIDIIRSQNKRGPGKRAIDKVDEIDEIDEIDAIDAIDEIDEADEIDEVNKVNEKKQKIHQ